MKSLSLPQNVFFRVNALHAGGPLPSAPTPPLGLWVACGSGVRGFEVLGGEGSGSAGIHSVRRHRIDRGQPVQARRVARSCWAADGCASSSSTVEEVLYGSVWKKISLLLTTDDVVMLRTAARRWNVADRCGAPGDTFFWLLKTEPVEKTWRHDE